MSRNSCEGCGTDHKPYFGQWWTSRWGNVWYCEDCSKKKQQESAR